MEKIKELFKKYREPILYIIFGGFTTLVNYVIYIALRFLNVDIYVTNICAWIGAVLFAYFTNRGIVFNSQSKKFDERVKEILSFYAARVFSLLIEMLMLYIFVTLMQLNEFLMKLLIQFIVIALNYIFSKFFIFKKKKTED